MAVTVLFAATAERWRDYKEPLTEAFREAGVDAHLVLDADPSDVEYIVYAPNSDIQDFSPFTQLKAVLSLWAGVEQVVGNPTLHVPLARMVDENLTRGMVEWVCGHVLRYHLELDQQIIVQDGIWRPNAPPVATDRRVGVLGLGALGRACAEMLATLGFATAGWSRSEKMINGIACLSGDDGLDKLLNRSDILVLLLPDTPDTTDIIDATTLARLPKGARIINPGRGTLIDDAALLDALDKGLVSHATLDVFRVEPLPSGHPYWAHPKVTVTPHIASETRPASASRVIAENIRRGETGQPFLHLVDVQRGY